MPQRRGVKVRALRHFAGRFVALFETSALQNAHKVLPPHAATHAINPLFTCTQGLDQATNTLIGEMMKAQAGGGAAAQGNAPGLQSQMGSQGVVSLDTPQAKSGGCCS